MEHEDKQQAIDWAKSHVAKYPNHRIEFMLDRQEEVALFRDSFGLNVTPFNYNALSDERIYRILPRNKKYDAVYIARPTKHKHLKLCEQIAGKWLWITYDVDESPSLTRETLEMPNVHAPQFEDGQFTRHMPRAECASMICQSGCGLALSDIEGAMHVSIEYLLCGLPVVQTPTEDCTRAEFFDPRTTVTVNPNMYSVAQAVLDARELGRQTGPKAIRAITLQKMQPHRERFVDAVRRAYEFVGIAHDPAYDLFHMQTPYMVFWQPVDKVLTGGDEKNQKLLAVAAEEPRTRKLWSSLSERYWEEPLAVPETVA